MIQKVIEPRLLRLNGVANVVIDDLEEKQLIVELDQERLQTHNISLSSLGWQLNQNNTNISLGRVMDGDQRYMVRAIGEFSPRRGYCQYAAFGWSVSPRRHRRDQTTASPKSASYERLNGTDALQLEIFKASTANVVDGRRGRSSPSWATLEAEYAGQLEIAIVRNRAESVLAEAGTLLNSALLGAFLAMIIIFVFLRNIRSTIVIALAIPISALCVFIGMYVAREVFESTITLNMVSMMGLMLAVGMLVDPAVVVLESIFRRRQEDGLEADEGLPASGSREVGMAVLGLGTDDDLRLRALLLPLRWPFSCVDEGTPGSLYAVAVVVSMIVALSLIPLASSPAAPHWGRALRPLAQATSGSRSWWGIAYWGGQCRWLERVAVLVGPLVGG